MRAIVIRCFYFVVALIVSSVIAPGQDAAEV
jgi:hypothetical protein